MESNRIIDHLSSVLGDNFQLTLKDVENEENKNDQEIIYGLICLHEDLKFYKTKSDHLLDNLKNTLFNSAAITITGRNGVIKEVNDYFINLSGYTTDDLYGEKMTLIDAEEGQTIDYDTLNLDVISGKTWRGEIKSVRKNSETFWLSTHIFPVRNTNEEIYEYWSISTDISETKRVEQQLRDSNKELQDFSNKLSNDILDPARQVKELTNFIEEDFSDQFSEECQEMFSLLKTRSNSLYDYINELIEFNKLDNNNLGETLVDCKTEIEKILLNIQPHSQIQITIQDNFPIIFGNRMKINQVFKSILSNSINTIDKGVGEISITCDRHSDFYHFNIVDNGVGISKENIDSLFDVFTTTQNKKRTKLFGIGLSLSKKIILDHGCTIGCDSELDSGTKFWFTWPVKRD